MSTAAPTRTRLRVLQCITRLGLGGSERVGLSLIRGFGAELESAVFTVHGTVRDPVGHAMRAELAAAGVPWFTGTAVPMKAGGMIPAGLALARAVRAFRPDVLHLHSETPEAAAAMMRFLRPATRRVAVLRTIHNSVFWRFWPRVGRWCDHRLADARIACVSAAAKDEFLRYRSESGAPPPPVEPAIIYNGVDLPPAAPRIAPADPARRRVLFAGRFDPQKGTDLLPRILSRTRLPAGVSGELTLVGHGAHESLLRDLAAHPPAGWTVRLQPPVPRLADLLPEYDLFIMPSRFEGLGLTAIEASLAGLPVVATDAPGLREALPPEHPWLAAPGDAVSMAETLVLALTRIDRWRSAVEAAQRFARDRFSPEIMVSRYRRVYLDR